MGVIRIFRINPEDLVHALFNLMIEIRWGVSGGFRNGPVRVCIS